MDAGEWRLALGVVGQLQNDSMLGDTLKPAAAGAAVTMLSDLRDDQERVDKYWSRLKQLRAKRQQLAAKVGMLPLLLSGCMASACEIYFCIEMGPLILDSCRI